MMRTILKTLMLAVALIGWSVLPAYAEPGAGEGGEDEISARIQKQMDKIIELMEKNEKALLALSTGDKARPEAVDVKPPALPPEGTSVKPPEGGGDASGEDVQKALDELIKGQRKAAGTIPGELEELVRMVPQWSSCGSGSGEPQDSASQPKPENRDQRKELGEGEKEGEKPEDKQGSKDPKNPREPEGRRDGQPDDAESNGTPRRPNVPAWMASLPSQIRDAIVRGDFEQIPAQYRAKIQEYIKWLQAETEEGRK